jgi:glutamine synthetase adenylyltransferase
MKANIEVSFKAYTHFWIQRRAPSRSSAECWEEYATKRGTWVTGDFTLIAALERIIKEVYPGKEFIEIVEIPQRRKDTKIFKLYGPEPTDKRRKRFRLLVTFGNIKIIKTKNYHRDKD